MTEEQKKKHPRRKNNKIADRLAGWWGDLSTPVKVSRLFILSVVSCLFLIGVWVYCSELAKFIAYLVGGALLVVQIYASNRRAAAAEETAKAMQKTVELTEKGNIAERFKDAIAHLGHDTASIRLGGIYALHHIAVEEEEYRGRVFEILCAHIRGITTGDGYEPQVLLINGQPTANVRQPIEVESILDLVFKRAEGHETYKSLKAHLEYVNLLGARLRDAELCGANLTFANLQAADLRSINLQSAILWDANLRGSRLSCAKLQRASILDADLPNADLAFAQLQGAVLQRANLQGVDLQGADLQGADLHSVKLQGANLRDANLRGTILWGAELDGTRFSDVDLKDAKLDGVNFLGAYLKNAKGLKPEQLLRVKTLYKAELPNGMEEDIRQQKPELLERPN